MARKLSEDPCKPFRIKFTDLKTKQAQRVRIAWDVLAQIKRKTWTVEHGTYLDFSGVEDYGDLIEHEGDYVESFLGLQELLKSPNGNKCEACALGSMVCSLTLNNGNFNAFETRSRWDQTDKLRDFFEMGQLELIENCFEGNSITGYTSSHVYPEYHSLRDSAPARLTLIMKNIIRNNGTFIPEQDLKKAKK